MIIKIWEWIEREFEEFGVEVVNGIMEWVTDLFILIERGRKND